jgi:hypothetical protein
MVWMAASVAASFQEKCVCASHMPGISVAPAPSMTVAPAGEIGAVLRPHLSDAVALHQHAAGVGVGAGAVEDAHVGEQGVAHGLLLMPPSG